jgi:CBS domain-containing protein
MKAILSIPTTGADWDSVSSRTVAGYMTNRLPSVDEHESVLLAWELLRRGQFSHLSVLTTDGHFLGVLDRASLATGYARGGLQFADRPVGELLRNDHVLHGPAGGPATHTVRWTDPLATAVRVMGECGTDVLAVVNDRQVFVGLLTATDIVAALAGRRHRPSRLAQSGPTLFRMQPVPAPGERSR